MCSADGQVRSTEALIVRTVHTAVHLQVPLDWEMFQAASDNDIEAYSDTIMCFNKKCVKQVSSK